MEYISKKVAAYGQFVLVLIKIKSANTIKVCRSIIKHKNKIYKTMREIVVMQEPEKKLLSQIFVDKYIQLG